MTNESRANDPHRPPQRDTAVARCAITAAVTAARAVAGPHPGSAARAILIGLDRDDDVVLVRRLDTTSEHPLSVTPAGAIATAVLVIVGKPQQIGPLLAGLTPLHDDLRSGDITRATTIGCRDLRPGTAWHELASDGTDGVIESGDVATNRPSRWPRGRLVAQVVGIAVGFAIILLGIELLAEPSPGDQFCGDPAPIASTAEISSEPHRYHDMRIRLIRIEEVVALSIRSDNR